VASSSSKAETAGKPCDLRGLSRISNAAGGGVSRRECVN
jgi:hypothetical protein